MPALANGLTQHTTGSTSLNSAWNFSRISSQLTLMDVMPYPKHTTTNRQPIRALRTNELAPPPTSRPIVNYRLISMYKLIAQGSVARKEKTEKRKSENRKTNKQPYEFWFFFWFFPIFFDYFWFFPYLFSRKFSKVHNMYTRRERVGKSPTEHASTIVGSFEGSECWFTSNCFRRSCCDWLCKNCARWEPHGWSESLVGTGLIPKMIIWASWQIKESAMLFKELCTEQMVSVVQSVSMCSEAAGSWVTQLAE